MCVGEGRTSVRGLRVKKEEEAGELVIEGKKSGAKGEGGYWTLVIERVQRSWVGEAVQRSNCYMYGE